MISPSDNSENESGTPNQYGLLKSHFVFPDTDQVWNHIHIVVSIFEARSQSAGTINNAYSPDLEYLLGPRMAVIEGEVETWCFERQVTVGWIRLVEETYYYNQVVHSV